MAELDSGSPMEGFEAMPAETQWQVAFSTALLCVEALWKEYDAAQTDQVTK